MYGSTLRNTASKSTSATSVEMKRDMLKEQISFFRQKIICV